MALSSRRDFVKRMLGSTGVAPLVRALGRPVDVSGGAKAMVDPAGGKTAAVRSRMPVLFVGHGSPMNAVEENAWSRGMERMAELIPTPQAILSISAHWFVRGTFTTGNSHPETIHDFGGFPQALYQVDYPAAGHPGLARHVVRMLGERRAAVSSEWGLDHGTWSVLVHLRPAADLPVVQLSVDAGLRPSDLLAIGRALAPLRDEGVLLMGSGNLTHNLRHAFSAWRSGNLATPEWAERFDSEVAQAVEQHDQGYLAGALETEAGRMAHPTPDHFLPLLYVVGAADAGDPVRTPMAGFDMGSLSMRSILIG